MLWAFVRRHLHCLFHLHRAITVWDQGRPVYIGCECGKYYYEHLPEGP